MRYLGVPTPDATFARYADMRRELCALRGNCFPMNDDYLALSDLIAALDRTATHFTGADDFYAGRSVPYSAPVPPPKA